MDFVNSAETLRLAAGIVGGVLMCTWSIAALWVIAKGSKTRGRGA